MPPAVSNCCATVVSPGADRLPASRIASRLATSFDRNCIAVTCWNSAKSSKLRWVSRARLSRRLARASAMACDMVGLSPEIVN
ncbi:MAG: hypothetical protein DCF31_02710 [Alphaproteobacteria bacterium]|nr:MAG: hypothetical protein DCF31_02710 [Alphaproteobacteria bacterium]